MVGLLVGILTESLLAIVPDQEMLIQKLNQQREFMEYVDLAVSNLPEGALEDYSQPPVIEADPVTEYDLKMTPVKSLTDEFHLAIFYDQRANRSFLQGDYNATHRDLMKSLFHLRNVYNETLKYYTDSTQILLDSAATVINRTRDPDALYYLKKGYGQLVSARQSYERGDNIQWKLFSNQVNYYRQGILEARLARRFAILAYINASLPRVEKPTEKISFGREALPLLEGDRPDYFQSIQDMIETLMARNLMVKEFKAYFGSKPVQIQILEMHQDDYGKFVSGRSSVRNRMIMIQATKLDMLPTLRPERHTDREPASGDSSGSGNTGAANSPAGNGTGGQRNGGGSTNGSPASSP